MKWSTSVAEPNAEQMTCLTLVNSMFVHIVLIVCLPHSVYVYFCFSYSDSIASNDFGCVGGGGVDYFVDVIRLNVQLNTTLHHIKFHLIE